MADRRRQIQNKKKKKEQKSKPLTPIYFCDAPDCLEISSEKQKQSCSKCMCFYYCNVECQKKHWNEHKKYCARFQLTAKIIALAEAAKAVEAKID